MWMTREDGSRRLKPNAIPTIFSKNLLTSLTKQNMETIIEAAKTEPDNASNKMEEISSEEDITEEEKNDVISILSNGKGTSDPFALQRLEQLEMLWKKSERSRVQMKKMLGQAKKKIKRLETEVGKNRISLNISNIFNENQVSMLSGKYKKMPNWCNNTLLKAYKLKFAYGTAGYEELLKANFPLLSIRTLTRKLESLKFKSGILHEIFEFMKIKISGFEKEIDKDRTLVLDEMSITTGNTGFYDSSTNTITGNVTLPDHDESDIATHGLVFMLAGIASRWKQVVGYYFTGDNVNGEKLKPIIEVIIKEAEKIGLLVYNITSDMGPSNQAMWRAFGIYVSNIVVKNNCRHPCFSDWLLYFYSDVPHALKNVKTGFVNNKTITIPDNFVNRFALPTNLASCSHLNDVLTAENCDIKLAPKLRSEYLSRNNHFQKM